MRKVASEDVGSVQAKLEKFLEGKAKNKLNINMNISFGSILDTAYEYLHMA